MATPTVRKAIPIEQSTVLELGTINLGTYATGGIAVDATGDLEYFHAIVQPTGGYVAEYDPSTKKVKVYRDNATATAAPLPEVAATTDLSAVNFAFAGYRTT